MDPNGEIMATIDNNGVCVISDVETGECKSHQNLRRPKVFGKFSYVIFHIDTSLMKRLGEPLSLEHEYWRPHIVRKM